MSPPKRFFFSKNEGDSGFQTPSDDSLTLLPPKRSIKPTG